MGSKTYTDYQNQVDLWAQVPTDILGTDNRNSFLEAAVNAYSKDRPREVMDDAVGDGTFNRSLPSDWEDGFSYMIAKIENYDADNQEPDYIEDDEWEFYRTADDTLKIRFLAWEPTSAETSRLRYTIRHVLDTGVSATQTMPDADFDAICILAASYMCQAAANYCARFSSSTIGADGVEWGVKGQNYSQRSVELLQMYNDAMGKGKEVAVKAGATRGNWRTRMADKTRHFTHGKRWY